MKIHIELNSKEIDILSNNNKEPIQYEFLIDVYTESNKEISAKEETVIYSGLLWALLSMLPSTTIHTLFQRWNDLVNEINNGLSEGKTLKIRNADKDNA